MVDSTDFKDQVVKVVLSLARLNTYIIINGDKLVLKNAAKVPDELKKEMISIRPQLFDRLVESRRIATEQIFTCRRYLKVANVDLNRCCYYEANGDCQLPIFPKCLEWLKTNPQKQSDINVAEHDESVTDDDVKQFNEAGAKVTIDIPSYGELTIIPDGIIPVAGEMTASGLREFLRVREVFNGGDLVSTGPDIRTQLEQ